MTDELKITQSMLHGGVSGAKVLSKGSIEHSDIE